MAVTYTVFCFSKFLKSLVAADHEKLMENNIVRESFSVPSSYKSLWGITVIGLQQAPCIPVEICTLENIVICNMRELVSCLANSSTQKMEEIYYLERSGSFRTPYSYRQKTVLTFLLLFLNSWSSTTTKYYSDLSIASVFLRISPYIFISTGELQDVSFKKQKIFSIHIIR
jgi:hypothetical protein